MWTLSARWVVPVVSPPIADGIVTFDKYFIRYVGKPDGRRIDERFDEAILLPGFVNAHTHLDLTGAAGQTPPCLPFPDWLRSVISYRARRDAGQTESDIRDGADRCIAAGTTLVGDIAAGGLSTSVLRQHPLHTRIFFELIGLTRERLDAAFNQWATWLFDQQGESHLKWSFSPHSPYSFRVDGLERLRAFPRPVAIHVAESRDEMELLDHQTGPFVEFLESLGVYDPPGLPEGMGDLLQRLRVLEKPLLVHGNYLEPSCPLPNRMTLVYCPRTHAAFGHPPHPFREFMARGIRVVLGTDSLASNPDLSVLNEARFVASRHADVRLGDLLTMITASAADALGWRAGRLAVGYPADFAVVAMADPVVDPVADLLQNQAPVSAVYVSGCRAV